MLTKKAIFGTLVSLSAMTCACSIEAPDRCDNVVCETDNGSGTCNGETGTCEYECDEGYLLKDKTKCIDEACYKIDCPINHGSGVCIKGECNYNCDEGYKLVENKCVDKCITEKMICSIDNGSANCNEGICIYKCNAGLYVKGNICSEEPCSGEDCSVGDTIPFGNYNNSTIQWYVLDKDATNHRLMLLAMTGVVKKKYNEVFEAITWENSTIRSWLNGYGSSKNKQGIDYTTDNFILNAFTSEERAKIPLVTIENPDNPQHGTDGGNNTEDYVFLLSIIDVENLLGITSVMCSKIDCTSYWWLRSPGKNKDDASYVDTEGIMDSEGNDVNGLHPIRPALWINY